MRLFAIIDGRRREKKGVAAVLAPAAHDVGAAFDGLDHRRDVPRIVLQVAVGGDDDAAARVVKSRRESRRLAEIPAEADDRQVRIDCLQPRQGLEALVRAAIVDDDELVRPSPRAQRARQHAVQLVERRGFVPHRNDHGQVDHRHDLIGFCGSGLWSRAYIRRSRPRGRRRVPATPRSRARQRKRPPGSRTSSARYPSAT